MQLTQKIRIFPDKQQEEVLWKTSDICRRLYNILLSERLLCWENDYELTWLDQQNRLPKLKNKDAELKTIYSKTLQMVVRQVNQDIKSFISLQEVDENTSHPRFKGKKYFTTMVFNQSGFKMEKGFIRISKPKMKIKIPDKFTFEKVYQVSIYKKDNNFYISVVYNKKPVPYKDNKKYQAIDLGITNIVTAVNSNGKFIQIKNQRPDKYWQKKIEKIQSRRDHCKRGSRKWNMLNKNLKRMKRKCANQIKDFQHKISRKIIDNTKANTLIVGDLQIKQMAKRKEGKQNHKRARGLNRAIQNTGTMGRFTNFLTYKAELAGKKVVKIDERDTTKMCCVCSKRSNRPLSERNIECDCGNNIDRDKNSAINQMIRFLSQNAKWTGLSEFQANLRHTGIPIQVSHSQEAASSNPSGFR